LVLLSFSSHASAVRCHSLAMALRLGLAGMRTAWILHCSLHGGLDMGSFKRQFSARALDAAGDERG
jgi:hypothetical protein